MHGERTPIAERRPQDWDAPGIERRNVISIHTESRRVMPRVIVICEQVDDRRRRSPTLNEHINPVDMADEQSSLQFLERLAWAISDAEETEQLFGRALTPWVVTRPGPAPVRDDELMLDQLLDKDLQLWAHPALDEKRRWACRGRLARSSGDFRDRARRRA
jgi:hypothetical protein